MSNISPKLLYIISDFPHVRRGFSAHELSELSKHFEIVVHSMNKPSSVDEQWLASGFPELQNLSYIELGKLDILLGVFSVLSLRVTVSQIREIVSFATKDFKGGVKYWYGLLYGCALVRKFGKSGFSRVHADFASMPATVGMSVANILEVPSSFTSHAFDIYTEIPNGRATKSIISKKISEASFVYAENTRVLALLQELCLTANDEKKLSIKRNGIKYSYENRLNETDNNHNKKMMSIVALGGLVSKKGFDVLIKSVGILEHRGIAIDLSIYGDGPEKDTLKQLAVSLRVSVAFPGSYMYSELTGILHGADLLVMPSRRALDGDMDGVPTVLIEALSHCVAVISTDIGSITDLVRHDETGLIFSSEDEESLANAIQFYKENPDTKAQHAMAGCVLVEKEYDTAFINKGMVESVLNCEGLKV